MDITVIDTIMGSGKTTWAINYMNSHPEKNFIVIAPLLNECDRYQKEVKTVKLVAPKHNGKGKFKNFKELICEGKSIITTHALMRQMDLTTVELIRAKNYTLIIDEALEVLEKYPLKKADIDIIFKQQLISIDDNGYLMWHDENYDGEKYKEVKELCDLRTLMSYKNEDGSISKIIMWNFPSEFFNCFEESFIMTYLWKGSLQKAYFEFHDVKYHHMMLDRDRKIVAYNEDISKVSQIKCGNRIRIYEGNLNDIGNPIGQKRPLTKTWYGNCTKTDVGKELLLQVKNNTSNFFRNILNSPSEFNMYTTYKDYKGYVKGAGYTKGFVPCNCRGTNDFAHKTALAYLIDFNPVPEVETFMNFYDIKIDADSYALGTLLQWIWRSKVRENGSDEECTVDLYIPSKRMRDLLLQWKDGKI